MDGPVKQALGGGRRSDWEERVRRLRRALPLQILVVAAAYYVTGRLGLALAIPPGYATAVWPPSGIALAALLLCGWRVWPGVMLGSFLINVPTGFDAGTGAALAVSLAIPACIGCGAALQAVAGAFLVRRFVGFPCGLVEVGQVARLLVLGGMVACLINPTVGVGTLILAGRVVLANVPFNWATWWAGDVIGVFVFTPLALAWLSPPRDQWQKRRAAITAALAVTFAIVVAAVSYIATVERSNLSRDFNDRTAGLPVELEKATTLNLDTVGAVQALLASSPALSRSQFDLFASRIRAHAPSIQALEWAPRITLAERSAFEANERSEGLAGFEITELADGRLVRAGEREEYFPITYVEPLAGNEPAIGFDLGSHPGRHAALDAARVSGKTSVSERITLVQGGENSDGFLAFTPVYRTTQAGEGAGQPRGDLAGFALGVFRFADVVRQALRGYDLAGTHLWLLDETDPAHPVLLYTNGSEAPFALELQELGLFGGTATLGNRATLEVGGRHWVLQTAPTQLFLVRYRLQDSWIVLVVGLLFTSLVGASVVVLTGREGMLRMLFDGNPQPMWAWDRETLRFVEVNDAAVLKYGYSRAEFLKMRITDIRPAEDVPRLTGHVASLRGTYRSPTLWRHRLRDGTIIDVEIAAHDVELSGRLVALVVAHDVTERKRVEEALIESERSARSIIDTALDAFIQMDESGRILEWNRQAETTFGWSREEAIGKNLGELIVPEVHRARHAQGLARYLQTGESKFLGKRIEIEGLRKDGGEMKIELAVTGLARKSGHVFNAFVSDITERRAREELHRQTQRMEAVGQLTGGIAHDFNNMLTVITCTIDTLASAVSHQPKLFDIAKTIGEAAEHGAQLTQSLLAFARKQPLQPVDTDINALITEAAKLLRPSLGEHIEIESLLAKDAWPASVDPSQLTTALLNLAVNARDAMPNGGKLVLETRNVELDDAYALVNPEVRPGSFVMIAVSDNGTGIPDDLREKVFEPFFTTKEQGKGTGLGLSMVYGFVKQSGGHIKVYSEEGRGTSIKIYLPRSSTAAIDRARDVAPVSVEGGSEIILVVEDDALVRNSVRLQLESLGYAVLSAADGRAALELVDGGSRFDLLLTDIIMPGGLNGRQLADEVIKRRPSARVLFTSGYTENAILHHGRLDAGVLLLAKPYRKADLARMVRMAIDRTRAAPPLADVTARELRRMGKL
jgi:PAS domain S-box-containing protein